MTLGENKKITLGLIEEYSKNNNNLTDDEDIADRMNFIYSTAYQELSQNKKIIKTKVLREIQNKTEDGYDSYTLPSSVYQLSNVIALDEYNIPKTADYYILGKKIYLSKATNYKYILEYFAYPEIITDETQDDFELEIDQDVQLILPYAVANDILKTDPSTDYTAFLAEYKRKLESLDTRIKNVTVRFKEGVL